MRARCMGSRASPQYHEIKVKRSNEAVNDAGNAYRPKVFFNEG